MATATKLPNLPTFNYVIDDSPSCHQSLKYWGGKSNEVGKAIFEIASGLHNYHGTGVTHHTAGSRLSEALNSASKTLKADPLLEEPLIKFADAFNRIECYRDMLLTQTEMLGVQPLMKMVKEFDKMKKGQSRLTKASQNLHVTWDKFASLPHQSHLQDPTQLDKHAHQMITARQKYQLLLAQYIDCVRDTNNRKKILLLQKLLEHMLAEFSFYNFCSQILKELEPYMNSLFTNIQEKLIESEKLSSEDEATRRKSEIEIDTKAQEERNLFPSGDLWPGSTQNTGRFLNKVGGMISSSVRRTYRSSHSGSVSKSEDEQDWELIEDPSKKQDERNESISNSVPSNASQFYLPADGENGSTTENLDHQSKDQEEYEKLTGNREPEKENANKTIDTYSQEDGNNKVAPEPEQPQSNFSRFPFTYKSTHEDEFCKKGYLRIKQKAFPKSKYPLLYFILDKKYGEMLSQGQEQRQPMLFAKLLLSAVRPCDVTETDRNYCFQDGIAAALDGNQDRKRMNARGRSVKDHAKTSTDCQNVVERLKAVEGNDLCADCNCPRPGWASASVGCLLCIECSGMHRGLGVHISKVKSLSLDKWDTDLVEFMEAKGNKKVNAIYEANLSDTTKINRSSSKDERRDYIIAKYVEKRFMLKPEEKVINESSENSTESLVKPSEDDIDENTLSVMCLVEDCEECNAGRHGASGQQWIHEIKASTVNDENQVDKTFSHPLE